MSDAMREPSLRLRAANVIQLSRIRRGTKESAHVSARRWQVLRTAAAGPSGGSRRAGTTLDIGRRGSRLRLREVLHLNPGTPSSSPALSSFSAADFARFLCFLGERRSVD